MAKLSNKSVLETDHVNFDKRRLYEKEIQPKAERLLQLCYLYNIPFAFVAAIYDSDRETKYDGTVMMAQEKKVDNGRMVLKDDCIKELGFHMQGFKMDEYLEINTDNL